MKLSPSFLLDIHAKVQVGTYFNAIDTLDDNIKYGHSNLIEDYYWNYAYNIKCTKGQLTKSIDNIKQFAASINREPAIYLTPDCRPKNLIGLLSPIEIEEEVWMTFKKRGKTQILLNNALDIRLIFNEQPDSSFIEVFDNAYGGGSPESSGYYGLPKEYIDSIKNSKPQEGVSIAHFIGQKEGVAVAIASIFICDSFAGLYNVGTLYEARRNNFGSEISKVAMKFALEKNCKTIFLQTKADSEVETMYNKIGFERAFIGAFVKI